MSNATHDSRNSGDSRRRRSRGGSNRNRNTNQGDHRSRDDSRSRESRGDQGNSQGRRQDSGRSEEFRPQAPAPRKYAPAKLTLWQKLLRMIGLYKDPAPPSRYDRKSEPAKQESTPFPKTAPKSNTRNARSGEGEGDSRPPREPREKRTDGDRPPRKERAPRNTDKPRGGDPSSVESTRVYVGNLSYDVSEQDLQELFKGIGGVRNIEVVYNRSTHRSKGYGFVEMLRMDDARQAVEVLHDQPFMGRKLTVSGAKSKGQDEREDAEDRGDDQPARKVVLASTHPAVTEITEPLQASGEPVIETIIEQVVETPEAVVTAEDLAAKYGFEEPKEKTGEA